jgi:uncharacterized protein (TIGR00369 family)
MEEKDLGHARQSNLWPAGAIGGRSVREERPSGSEPARWSARIEPAIWTEPIRGGFPDPRILGLPGIEQIRSYLQGHMPPPPPFHLMGLRMTEVLEGAVTFTMPASEWLLPPAGFVQLGVLAILADAALGCSIQTALPPGQPYTTSDLSLTFLRPLRADGGTITSRGRLIHAGSSLAVAETLIEDGASRPVAHGTTRCFLLPPISGLSAPAPSTSDPPTALSDDPYLRPVAGRPLTQTEWDELSGTDVLEGLGTGRLPAPPISHLTGLRVLDADAGRATFGLPASAWLTSPTSLIQGGAIALLADTVLAMAAQSTCPPRTTATPLDLKVNYLRPVASDGRELIGRGTVVHRGRTLTVATADLENADGKRVAVATGTALIRPGPWLAGEPGAPEEEA